MLINLRNALMAGNRLPYQSELEYIQSTGNASWIDSGVVNNANIRVTATAQCVAAGGTLDLYVFGSGWGANNTTALGIVYSDAWKSTNGRCMLLSRGTSGASFSPDIGFDMSGDGKFHTFEYISSATESSISVDNGTPFSITTERNLNGTTTYGIFGPRNQSTTSGTTRIAALKVYDINNNLLNDYTPVLDWDGNAKMFDRVTGTYPTHYGTFVAGPEIHAVEYIESHGTEYLLTGYNPDSATRVQARFISTETAANFRWLFAARNQDVAGDGYGFGAGTAGLITSDYNNRVSSPTDVLTNGVAYNIDKNRNVATYNAATLTNAASTFTVSYPLVIFGLNSHSSVNTTSLAKARCVYFTIYNNDVLVHDFKPVRVGSGSTWEGTMLDTVNRRVYRNAGTGAFGYGNDLKYPIPAS